MKSPVLFLIFNRPDTTREVFEMIRAARPPRLYVAADGARPSRVGESERCREVRTISTAVDWPCEVRTLFRDENVGCKVGVSSGIDWFFSQENEGVILEDDVLPVTSFFDYCDELLERYRSDSRVAMISGCNLVSQRLNHKESYFFSRYSHIWGWASWRRAWTSYDVQMQDWPDWRDSGGLAKASGGNPFFEAYWTNIFDSVWRGEIDTWDYQWTYSCWRHEGLAALPSSNQTRNLGFGAGATHTTGEVPGYIGASPPELLDFPLRHPDRVERSVKSDHVIDSTLFGLNAIGEFKRRAKSSGISRRLVSTVKSFWKGIPGG